MQGITPFLWFDNQAEEAAEFYVSLFPNSRMIDVTHSETDGPAPGGLVVVATFELDGRQFMALNGGPEFQFTEAISFMVHCETQQEVDRLWEKLSEGGEPGRCGWLKDRYGVSWQVVPSVLSEMMGSGDPERSKRVMEAILQMDKLDIAALQRAYAG